MLGIKTTSESTLDSKMTAVADKFGITPHSSLVYKRQIRRKLVLTMDEITSDMYKIKDVIGIPGQKLPFFGIIPVVMSMAKAYLGMPPLSGNIKSEMDCIVKEMDCIMRAMESVAWDLKIPYFGTISRILSTAETRLGITVPLPASAKRTRCRAVLQAMYGHSAV